MSEHIAHIQHLNIDELERGRLHTFWFDLVSDAFGLPISIPLMVGRGSEDGPVLGITAAVHGNELNGIPVIQRLFKELEGENVSGTVIGVPVVNTPAYMNMERRFTDGVDLNKIFPGTDSGNISDVYAFRFFNHIVTKFDYLMDLHTASTGRINSYYIRANMSEPRTSALARLQNAQIVVHNTPSDGTLRGAAEAIGIPSITLEVGNPSTFQKGMIRNGGTGIHNAMVHLNMLKAPIEESDDLTVYCSRSYWIYTRKGGILRVLPNLTDFVKKGDVIATQSNMFGKIVSTYTAPEDGIVIGKSISPVNQTGGRILHLGIVDA